MYWLLCEDQKREVRGKVDRLITRLSTVRGRSQRDQIFPFAGRKDLETARTIVEILSAPGDLVVDPFSGSGVFSYAATLVGRTVQAAEWEPYTHRMSTAPWRLPADEVINPALDTLLENITTVMDELYGIVCTCGNEHVLESQFFDRVPLRYTNVTPHERLGSNGETVVYRGRRRCPSCGATEKVFDRNDMLHLEDIDRRPIPASYATLFARPLIVNSRINITSNFANYGDFFPHRSKLALAALWDEIARCENEDVRAFFEEAFLSILPLAKYKDYRSKSQDLHVPSVQLRESNILYKFSEQIAARRRRLVEYHFESEFESPIICEDFRVLLGELPAKSASLVITDPPWTDGNAYFEKAQLYHPWIGFDLSKDDERLEREVVVTDAPSRRDVHNSERWWDDIETLFRESARVVADMGYLSLFFRPIPAGSWLRTVNRLKLVARKAGFEPLLTADVSSSDPSMRIQQSAQYAFSSDVVFLFLKVPEGLERTFIRDEDLDLMAYRAAADLQEERRGPFSEREWRLKFADLAVQSGAAAVNGTQYHDIVSRLFRRYCARLDSGMFLPRAETPFSGQVFGVPALERLFTYIPVVVDELDATEKVFTFERFLLRLAQYVENGTRALIAQVEGVDLRAALSPYAVRVGDSSLFRKNSAPSLPVGIRAVIELAPHEFEIFCGLLLSRMGFTSVAIMGRSGDRGVDISCSDPDGRRTVVQCKRYIGNVGSEPIQRLHSFSVTRGAVRRIVMTTSDFTRDALDEARNTATELINGAQLDSLIASTFGGADLIQAAVNGDT